MIRQTSYKVQFSFGEGHDFNIILSYLSNVFLSFVRSKLCYIFVYISINLEVQLPKHVIITLILKRPSFSTFLSINFISLFDNYFEIFLGSMLSEEVQLVHCTS